MGIGQFINSLPTLGLFLLAISFSFLAAEIGYFFGRKLKKQGLKEPEGPLGTVVGSTIGLLAFLLGFTFSFTETRFNERRTLMIQHAGAISGCYYRTTFIPEEQRFKIRKLLHEYSELLSGTETTTDVEAYLTKLKSIQTKMWRLTFTLRDADMDPHLRVLFINSLGEVSGTFRERKVVGMYFRIPDSIWISLFLLSFLSLFILGYHFGFGSTGRIISIIILSSSIAIVMIMIADMDSIIKTRFKISQDPIKESATMIDKNEKNPEF